MVPAEKLARMLCIYDCAHGTDGARGSSGSGCARGSRLTRRTRGTDRAGGARGSGCTRGTDRTGHIYTTTQKSYASKGHQAAIIKCLVK